MAALALSERKSIPWSINVPEFATTMTFQVVYRAKQTELTTGERAHPLADALTRRDASALLQTQHSHEPAAVSP